MVKRGFAFYCFALFLAPTLELDGGTVASGVRRTLGRLGLSCEFALRMAKSPQTSTFDFSSLENIDPKKLGAVKRNGLLASYRLHIVGMLDYWVRHPVEGARFQTFEAWKRKRKLLKSIKAFESDLKISSVEGLHVLLYEPVRHALHQIFIGDLIVGEHFPGEWIANRDAAIALWDEIFDHYQRRRRI